MPLITIIIPTYNRKELLEKAVLSVLRQSDGMPFETEIVIIDDGSTDGTREYIARFVDENPNISYTYQENGGVGKARNHGLSLMNEKSDFLIFLDSDDELTPKIIETCLKKWELLKKKGEFDTTLGFYFLCEDEYGNVIGEKRILEGRSERKLTYEDYLQGAIQSEMGLITKSSLFVEEPKLRYEEDITTEGVMWAKMWKYMGENNLEIRVLDTIGRIYKTDHSGEKRITKTVSHDRFRKNAIGNERVLAILEEDLSKKKLTHYHADILMRTGINWVLAGQKNIGIQFLKDSLTKEFSIKTLVLLTIARIHPKLLEILYTIYI